MKFLHKYGTRRNEIHRAKRELYLRLALVMAVVLFFAAMMVISQFRPKLDREQAGRLPDTANMGDPLSNPQLIRLRAEIAELAQTFREGLADGAVDLEELEILEVAIDKQREVIRLRGSEIAPRVDLDQLEELLTLYDEHMGQFLIAQSKRLEDEAERAMEARSYETALDALSRARNIQEEVNAQYPRSSARDSTRLHRLGNKLLAWQTRPFAEQADALREEAIALAAERRYEEARRKMQAALEQQQELNAGHRDSRYATISRLRQFEESWKVIQATEDADLVARLLQESRSALATEQTNLAIARAEEAEAIQSRLMAQFPGLTVTRPEILADINTLKDTAASLPAYQRILQMREEVRGMLRTRNMDAFKNAVSEWLRAQQGFARSYPRSRFADQLVEAEVAFLHAKRDEIPTLLETLHGNLLPVPGRPGVRLYRTEVPQILYTRVADENPSISADSQLPVDSVTWREASTFVQRLSWILAVPVRLPDRDTFMAALGEVEASTLDLHVWSSQNTDRETRPVGSTNANPAGFHDLLGNVSEWLDSGGASEPERVTAIGGSARDSLLRLAGVPEESRSATERNRFVGFRFMTTSGD
jgi:tetratricopeptide (TPR) repeat protein